MLPNERTPLYHGPFAKLCEGFIRFKRSLGRKYLAEAQGMKRFDQFTLQKGIQDPLLSKDLVNSFLTLRSTETPRNRELRRILMQQFSLYLTSLGYAAYCPPREKRRRTTRYTPYIFTEEELTRFFETVDHLQPMCNSPYMHRVLPVLFRFLYGCGLRISEALHLQIADVDLTEGLITIRHTKNDQERLIPLSPSLQKIALHYVQQVHSHPSPQDYFFPAHDRTVLIRLDVDHHFKKLLWESGIPYRGRGVGPRIHDFRHTFAVHSLRKSVTEGRDIYTTLPMLSVYLGHQSIAATEVYVRLTADSFPDILRSMEPSSHPIFPREEA